MEPINLEDLPEHALLLLDSAPIMYCLENHRRLAPRFQPCSKFKHGAGAVRGDRHHHCRGADRAPLQAGDEPLARRCCAMLRRSGSV
jgi:hypothetical protein